SGSGAASPSGAKGSPSASSTSSSTTLSPSIAQKSPVFSSVHHKAMYNHNPFKFLQHSKRQLSQELSTPQASKASPVHTIIRKHLGIIPDYHPHQFDLVMNPAKYIAQYLSVLSASSATTPTSTSNKSDDVTIVTPFTVHTRLKFQMIPNISTALST